MRDVDAREDIQVMSSAQSLLEDFGFTRSVHEPESTGDRDFEEIRARISSHL